MDETVLWQLSYGLYAISVSDGGEPVGCIVNTVFQVTNVDPIIALSMNKQNYTCGAIRRAGSFSVSILSQQTDPKAISQLGFFSSKDRNKFEGLVVHEESGVPYLDENCTGYLICDVLSMLDTETHAIITARVRQAHREGDGIPMTYAYYHEVIKGRAPKNAPTYREEPSDSAQAYVCDICGYVYEGDITREPQSYRCPICGVDLSHFKKK